MREPRTRLLVVAWALMATWTLSGCTQPAQVRYEESLARTPASAEHAVQSERLVELMRGLAWLRVDRLPQNMDIRGEEERRTQRIAKIALAMSEAADSIPGAAVGAGLNVVERAEFARLAEALKEQAQRLADAAPGLSRADMQVRIEAMDATCNRCHQQFRIPRESGAVD